MLSVILSLMSVMTIVLFIQEKQPQRSWPKDQIWLYRSCPKFFGSPMLDAVINNSTLDREMVHWLRHRPEAAWDR